MIPTSPGLISTHASEDDENDNLVGDGRPRFVGVVVSFARVLAVVEGVGIEPVKLGAPELFLQGVQQLRKNWLLFIPVVWRLIVGGGGLKWFASNLAVTATRANGNEAIMMMADKNFRERGFARCWRDGVTRWNKG